jgi:dolichol kinase
MVYIASFSVYALAFGAAVLSAMMACYYRRSVARFVAAMAVSFALLAVLTSIGDYQYFMAAFAIGGIIGWMITSAGSRYRTHGSAAVTERRRDAIHALIGVAAVALFAVVGLGYARYTLLIGMMALYTFNAVLNSYRHNSIARMLLRFERPDVVYGEGAALLAFGVLLVASTISSLNYVEFGFIALFFGDAAATIVGTYAGRIKMPYSRRKSVAGTFAFFAVTAALGLFAIGWWAVPFAAALALLESTETKADDNVLIAVGALVLYAVRAFA